MERELVRTRAVADELEVEYNAFTRAINALIQAGRRFSPEATRLANERSQIRLEWNRVLGRIRRMEAGQQ